VDTRTSIDDHDYQLPFLFQGKFAKLTVELHPFKGRSPRLSPSSSRLGLAGPAV
jgi:hypothetical protein